MTCGEAFEIALRDGIYVTHCNRCDEWEVRQIGEHKCGGTWAPVFVHPLEPRMRLEFQDLKSRGA